MQDKEELKAGRVDPVKDRKDRFVEAFSPLTRIL